jgi:PKD repeat protein
MKNYMILGVIAIVFLLALPGVVSAAPLRLSTTQSGTVSGDLYMGAFQNPAWRSQASTPGVKEFTQSFSIPAFTNIQWARLETVVYAAGTDARHGQTTVKFDGNGDGTYETTLGIEDQQTASTSDAEVYPVNDHMDRCYSDYRIWYDVTSLITSQNPAAYVKTENLDSSTFDGRVKETTLIVAYNDGDSDEVKYWINTGHDYQASGAPGVTTSFDTTSVPAGFTAATLRNVGLASKDALYTFNTLTPTGANPVAPYNFFEANSWDVTGGITAGSGSTFGYTNNGGSFKTTIAALTVRCPPPAQPDLVVTAISPNVGVGANLFANEPNVISVTVKNNGPGSSGASTLGVDVAGSAYTGNVDPLAADASQIVTVTDTVSRTGGASVTITATADSTGVVSESNEANNVLTSAQTVYNNGYKGKRFTGGSDINTQASFDGKYGLVYSAGNSVYNGAGWTEKTFSWTSADLTVPVGATVSSARLYQGYTWDQTPGGSPLWTMTFNGVTITPVATYTDRKGYGTYDYPQGLYVYDVTSQFNTAGNSMTITPGAGNNNGIYGAYLVVVYQDPATTVKKIWINDECDILNAGTARSATSDEATAFANFAGVDTSGGVSARAVAILASAGDSGKSKFFFNSNEYTGFWSDYLSSPQIGFSSYDVTGAITNGANTARMQSYDSGSGGDNMYAQNTILIVETSSTAPVAAFSGTPTSGMAPLTVAFTDASTGTGPFTYAWDFNNDGTPDSTSQNPSFTYTSAGAYTVKLTVTGPGGSDDEVKTDYINVNAPSEQPDLNVTKISPNSGAGDSLFANEPNIISVTVKNNGPGSAGASTISVDVAGSPYTATIDPLAADASQTVTVTDTVSRTAGASITITATADSTGIVSESDETNNVLTSVQSVYNNGYKGKRYTPELGGDLTTQITYDGRYDVKYSAGNSVYASAKWTSVTDTWTSSDLPVPSGATVVSARLYQPYSYNKMASDPAFTASFNSNPISTVATYKDVKGFGSYNYPYGLYVYDVTSSFSSAGNTLVLTPEGTAGTTNDYALFGAYLVVVYSDSTTTEKQIMINDEFDMICSRTSYSANNAEATAYATFSGVDTTDVTKAQAIAILASAGDPDKSKFFFNSNEYTGFWLDYQSTPQVGFSVYDVTSALQSGANEAGLQSLDPGTNGDNMYAMNVILVVENEDQTPGTVTLSLDPVSDAVPVGSSATYTIMMNNAPQGIAGYNISLRLDNPAIGEITAYTLPSWAVLNTTSDTFGDSIWLSGIDLQTQVEAGAMNVQFGTVTIRADQAGQTGLSLEYRKINADGGGNITPEISPADFTAYVPLTADFTASPLTGIAPIAVSFTDLSTGDPLPATWAWDFNGDGVVDSTDQNPVFTYPTGGTYTVNLTVSNAYSTSKKIREAYIFIRHNVIPLPGYTNPPTDPDDDNLYEDTNGNGYLDFDDVVAFYINMEWIEQNEPDPLAFDYNHNGYLDFDDVVVLYYEVLES